MILTYITSLFFFVSLDNNFKLKRGFPRRKGIDKILFVKKACRNFCSVSIILMEH